MFCSYNLFATLDVKKSDLCMPCLMCLVGLMSHGTCVCVCVYTRKHTKALGKVFL